MPASSWKAASPSIIKDTFSGFSGGRAPTALYSQVAAMMGTLLFNPYKALTVKSIECETTIEPGRATAEIEASELDAETYCPGDTVRATVFLRPYKGSRQRVGVKLKLPIDLPEGTYTATVCDEPASARADVRGNPNLAGPSSAEQILEAVKVLTAAKRTNLVMRLPIGVHGVAANGKSLPDLPGSMVQILLNSRRTGPLTMTKALMAKKATEWVIVGSDSVELSRDQNQEGDTQ